ncbi:MAG: hypothetical protein WBL29_20890 [Burkholderiales bacterium]
MRAAEHARADGAPDQAAGLRRLIASRDPGMLAVTGADLASYAPLALELAAASERAGRRVLLLDLTRGALAGRLDRAVRYELMHVIDAHKRLEEVVIAGPRDIPWLPAVRGVRALANAWRGARRFADFVERAGGAPQLVLAVAPAEELEMLAQVAAFATLLVIGQEGGGDLRACYAALKRAHAVRAVAPRVIYAGGLDAEAARRAHARLIQTSRAFLGGEPELVGRLWARPGAAASREFPSLTLEQLSRAVARWPLPQMAARAASRSAPRVTLRGSVSVSP